MPSASSSHVVLIPSFNTGAKLLETVSQARAHWSPVWVIIDGSTDGSGDALMEMQKSGTGVRVFVLPSNCGKGAAVFHGLQEAVNQGFTHVLTMDADGQHPASSLREFMNASMREPESMILGKPVFDASAPAIRVRGRKVSNWWANLETLWCGIGDSLFGLRVYPARALLDIMSSTVWMRRFDFDAEAVVRLAWKGVRPTNIDAPVRYLGKDEGGVSHFRYVRDNALLAWMHTRLMFGFLVRLPWLIWRAIANRS